MQYVCLFSSRQLYPPTDACYADQSCRCAPSIHSMFQRQMHWLLFRGSIVAERKNGNAGGLLLLGMEHVKQAVLALTDTHKSLYMMCGGACGAAASLFEKWAAESQGSAGSQRGHIQPSWADLMRIVIHNTHQSVTVLVKPPVVLLVWQGVSYMCVIAGRVDVFIGFFAP